MVQPQPVFHFSRLYINGIRSLSEISGSCFRTRQRPAFDPQPFHHPAGRPHTGRKIRPLAVADHDCHYGATALATGLLHVLFFSYGLLGASGIAFMLILLSSFANAKAGTIPLTFVLILILYLGNEFLSSANEDNISHFAHILGGICGSLFGFFKSWNLPPRRMED